MPPPVRKILSRKLRTIRVKNFRLNKKNYYLCLIKNHIMITIRDILITPYEIDVDRHNFILVKVGKYSAESKYAGQTKRTVEGYFHTLPAVLTKIIEELVRNRVAGRKDLDGTIVTLDTFIQERKKEVEIITKWVKYLSIDFDPAKLPTVTPKNFIEIAEGVESKSKKK